MQENQKLAKYIGLYFVVIGFLLTLPLVYLSYNFYIQKQRIIDFTRKELTGLVDLEPLIYKTNDYYLKWLDKKNTSESIAEIKTNLLKYTNQKNDILDSSNLILDPELETYHLIWTSMVASYEFEQSIIFQQSNMDAWNRLIESYNKSSRYLQKVINAKNDYSSYFNLINSLNSLDFKSNEFHKDFYQLNFDLRRSSMFVIKLELERRFNVATSELKMVLWGSGLIWLLAVGMSYFLYLFLIKKNLQLLVQINNSNEALERSAKLSMLGEMSAGIGHEIKNPLAIISASVQQLQDDNVSPEQRFKAAHRVDKMVSRINLIINSIKSYVHSGQQEEAKIINLVDSINDSLLLINLKASRASVKVVNRVSAKELLIKATAHEIEQVIINLVNNSIDALKDSDLKEVYIDLAEHESQKVYLIISDTGPGVPKEIQERIFEPLFTTKENGLGTGLGLSLSKKIIERFNGELKLDLTTQSGASFKIVLPRVLSFGELSQKLS